MFKIAVALALLPSANAMAGLCYGEVLDANYYTDCTLTYDTQSALDASSCPSSCTTGAGGVTGTGEGSAYTFSKGVGWCQSDLDETPTSIGDTRWFTADECWDGCVTDNGIDALFGAQYDCDSNGCECYCQSTCDCMEQAGETSMLFKLGNIASTSTCGSDDDSTDDDSVEGDYYYCTCADQATDEATCTSMLGADAWDTLPCSTLAAMVEIPLLYCQPMYDIFNAFDLADAVATCCADGLNGCTGVCVSSTSTVTAMTAANPVAHALPISELAAGDKVLAANSAGKQEFDEVEELLHGASADKFVELATSRDGAASQVVRATPHHTFPSCSFGNKFVKTTAAKDFAAGDCILTEHGRAKVVSATMSPAAKGEEAYTIVLKGKSDLVAVDGVFTHALPQSKAVKKAQKTQKALRGSAAATAGLTGFQKDVMDVVNKRIQNKMAKKTTAA
jgi:hypothetical protein